MIQVSSSVPQSPALLFTAFPPSTLPLPLREDCKSQICPCNANTRDISGKIICSSQPTSTSRHVLDPSATPSPVFLKAP
ncbi:hypothetical protein EYC84_005435 [Monilinia fructicola]|uniref:Uncharacterized protein n=1 Tax=Monilinia fructicola TaxID=38448 RepID=A0A5M9K181_MONFR|nr:hypothetical protein EYC84_005435 [Monilinia fructicola]